MSGNIRQRIPLFKSDSGQPANDVIFFCDKKIISFDPVLRVDMKWQFIHNFLDTGTAMEG